jgi:YhgE/Pip-like protein
MTDVRASQGPEKQGAANSAGSAGANVRARTVLGVPKVWMLPLAIPVVMIALVTTIYIGSVINPTGHLRGLPVRIVDQDVGATVSSAHVALGASVVHALTSSAAVSSRLALQVVSLSQAEGAMNSGSAYATLVIPPTFTESALMDAGYGAPPGTPTTPTVELLENGRLGSLGVNLAAGVLTPAIDQLSKQLGTKLESQSTATVRANRVLTGLLANPLAISVKSYRPLPSHSALGLSAFYVSLVSILAGFLAATAINSGVDGALGYAANDMGPRWKIRVPKRISRVQTLLTKWTIALVAAPLLTAVIVAIAVGAFGMYAPDFGILWLLLTLATIMVSFGTLALLAAFGNLGQLVAMVILIYLSLASSGGTIPIQALPGFFRTVGQVEPLRQLLGGSRDVLYFNAQWNIGLGHAVLVLGLEVVFWIALGIGFTSWYDRRNLYRVSPRIITTVEQAVSHQQPRP